MRVPPRLPVMRRLGLVVTSGGAGSPWKTVVEVRQPKGCWAGSVVEAVASTQSRLGLPQTA